MTMPNRITALVMELKMINDDEEIYIKCPQPVEVATRVNNGLTYILDMFEHPP